MHALKAYVGLEVWLHSLLTLALDKGQWSTSFLGQFTSQRKDSPAPTEQQARWTTQQGWAFWNAITVPWLFSLQPSH